MEAKKENKLGSMPIGKLLFSMSLPLMASMLIQALYNIVDGIYVSQLSENALTATTLAFPIQMLMISAAIGTGVGINSLLSRRLGEKNYDEVNHVATNGLFLGVLTMLLFVAFGLLFSRPFIAAFTENTEIIEMGTTYLRICTVYSLGVFLAVIFERLLQATGRSMLSMYSQLLGAIINIVLDPILIFGRYGFPEMGIAGAAVATVIGQFASLILSAVLNLVLNKEIKFKFKGFRPNGRIIWDIYKVGLPSIIMQSIGSVMTIGMNKILGGFSDTAVAVLGVYFKLQSFVFMPIFGLTQGMTPIIGYNYGAKRKERIMHTMKLGIIVATVIMAIGVLLFQIFPDKLMSLFETTDELMSIGMQALRVLSLNFIPAGIAITIGALFNGVGIGYLSMVNSILRQLVILLPVAYLLASAFGVYQVWYAYVIAELVSLVASIVEYVIVYRKRIKPLTRETSLDQPALTI